MRGKQRLILLGALTVLTLGCATAGGKGGNPSPSEGRAKDPLAVVAKAQLRIEMGEVTEGIGLLREALALDPTSDELKEELGLALAEVGIADEAVTILQNTANLSPIAEATLGMLLAQRAESPEQLAKAIPHLEKGVTAIPTGQQAQMVLAQSQIRLGRGTEAWPHLEALLADRPNDPRILLMAGQVKRSMGKTDESLAILDKAAAVPELRQRATLEMVETLASGKRYQEAADTLENLIKNDDNTPPAFLTRLATLLIRADNQTKASQVLNEALQKDPNNREALFLKASLSARQGEVAEAEQFYRRILASDPLDIDASLNLARLLMDTRHLDEARKLIDDIWKSISEGKQDIGDEASDVIQDRAAVELIDRKPEAALPWLERLQKRPLSRRTLALWVEYFRLKNAFTEGLTWLGKEIPGEDPASGRIIKGAILEFAVAVKNEEKVKQSLDSMVAGDAEDVLTAIGALQRRKSYGDVILVCQQVLPRLGEPGSLVFACAAAQERLGHWDIAVKELARLVAKEPENAAALNYLGYMFAERGVRLDEAKDLISKALKLDPTSGAYQDSMGWLYFRKMDLDRAEKHLTEAVRLEPFDATIQEHLGDLHRARGAIDKATEAYRKALSFEIEEPGQKERIEKKLAEIAADQKR